MSNVIGGQQRVRLIFDKRASNVLFAKGQKRLFSEPNGTNLMLTPIMGGGIEKAGRRGSNKNGKVNMGDEIFHDKKTDCAETVLYYGTKDAMNYYPVRGQAQIYRSGYQYYIDEVDKSKYAEFGKVTIDYIDAFDEDDIEKLSFDFNTPASNKYFSDILRNRANGVVEPGRMALFLYNGKPAINFSPTGNAMAFAKVWAKGPGTVKGDFHKDVVRNLKLIPGSRYKFIVDAYDAYDADIVYLEYLSEVTHFAQVEKYDFPVVTASIVRKKGDSWE